MVARSLGWMERRDTRRAGGDFVDFVHATRLNGAHPEDEGAGAAAGYDYLIHEHADTRTMVGRLRSNPK